MGLGSFLQQDDGSGFKGGVMSAFWKRQAVIESHANCFNQMVHTNWQTKEVVIWNWASKHLNDFEKKFLNDLGSRWVNSVQHPEKWSHKQVSLLQRIYTKAQNGLHKEKKKENLWWRVKCNNCGCDAVDFFEHHETRIPELVPTEWYCTLSCNEEKQKAAT